MAGKGGAMPGAGRKPNAERHAGKIATFTDLAAGGLVQCFDNLATLADGGHERLEFEEQPAGLVTRKGLTWLPARDEDGEVVRDPSGEPVMEVLRDGKGNPVISEVPAYPDLPPDQLVVTKRRRYVMAPDFRANEYLVDRVMGRPRQELEHSGPAGGPIPVAFEDAVAKFYGPAGGDRAPDG